MTNKLANSTVRIIQRCYSAAALATIAAELGAPLLPGSDIFMSLVAAGKAVNFDHAVETVAAYLENQEDASTHPIPLVERRALSR